MTGFDARKTTVAFGAAAFIFFGTGCATKKHVRQVVGPVEARVSQSERRNQEQQAAIGELNNSVTRADERAQDADSKATAAGESARQANDAALSARARADQGYSLAESTRTRLGELSENIDNYKAVTSENILFKVNQSKLTDEAKQMLDGAIGQLQNTKHYILEVQGFTDSTGDANSNLELSRRRADAVVRYLTTKHSVPLRQISMLGLGEDDPNADNKSREGRKQARRVEMRVFSRDLGANQNASTMPERTTGSASRVDDSSSQSTTPQQQK
ncbi:MAG: OmpA family protein [Bryobacteraceae bacterium]|nr:OmpA family protein [Bryobacteraceae bacterium]